MSGTTRTDCYAALGPQLGDAIVVSSLGYSSWCLYGAAHRAENLYLRGSMGCAVPLGLGIALAASDRQVLVFEGDGSVLMNLGALATVGAYGPTNLTVVIFDDGKYLTTGGQSTHTRRGTDLRAVALACGIRDVELVTEVARLSALVTGPRPAEGSRILVVRIDGAETRPHTAGMPPPYVNSYQVMQAIAAGTGGA